MNLDGTTWRPVWAAAVGIVALLFWVLRCRIQAFLALVMASIIVGLLAGMEPAKLLSSLQSGMGNTLGFVATVVGLGAMLGQLLESSGAARSLALSLVRAFGVPRAGWALMLAGFCIAIPVFFDVGFIILVPVVLELSRTTGYSVLAFAIPLLAGLAVTHSFVPPTPGPVAVAEILGADLGWVISLGIPLGLPVALVAGPLFGSWIARRIQIVPAVPESVEEVPTNLPHWAIGASLLALPLVLIVANTVTQTLAGKSGNVWVRWCTFVGHPFIALTISVLAALEVLGRRRGRSGMELMELCAKSLAPAGVIILVTGAGGMLKQVLMDSGVGRLLADLFARSALPPIVLGWLLAALVRIAQGSSTVAMITAAGLVAPILQNMAVSPPHRALLVLAIASGATILSHVNDSGFWLVGRYCGLDERQTLKSWTVMETIIALAGLGVCLIARQFVP
jgi:Gnt-I system low-affinity gluconate transporter